MGGKSCSQTGECTNCKDLDSYMLQAVPRKIQKNYQLPKQQDMHEIKSNNAFVCLFLLPIMPFLILFFSLKHKISCIKFAATESLVVAQVLLKVAVLSYGFNPELLLSKLMLC